MKLLKKYVASRNSFIKKQKENKALSYVNITQEFQYILQIPICEVSNSEYLFRLAPHLLD